LRRHRAADQPEPDESTVVRDPRAQDAGTAVGVFAVPGHRVIVARRPQATASTASVHRPWLARGARRLSLAISKVSGETGGVLTMNEPQVWTLIGAFVAGQAALIALVLRIVSVEIGSLRNEMNVRFDHLDRDVQALTRHVFGDR